MTDQGQSMVLRPDKNVYRRHQIKSVLWWSLALGIAGVVILFVLGADVPLPLMGLGIAVMVALFDIGFFLSVLGGSEGWGLAAGETWTVGHNGIDFDNADEGHTGHLAYRDIADVSLKYGNAVQLRLVEGRAVVIRYVSDPQAARALIDARLKKAMATA